MTAPFRLGLVGAGSVAAQHVDAATGLPDVEVVAVCDVRPDAAERLAAACGARAHPGHAELIAAGGLDGVVITAPHSLHAPITLDTAAAGLHVLVEKPMATTVADCRRMIEACRRHGVTLAVGHVTRFLPGVREAARLLRSGSLGRPVVITERRTARYDIGSRPEWFFDPELAGGGILMNVGIHSIDRAQWFGAAPVIRVTGQVWRSRPGVTVETDAVGLLELANGVRVALSVTGTGLPFTDEAEVVCERGALRLSRRDGLWTYQGEDTLQVLAPGAADDVSAGFAAQLTDFVAACREDHPPAVGGEQGRSAVATALTLYESARHGEPLAVGEPAPEVV